MAILLMRSRARSPQNGTLTELLTDAARTMRPRRYRASRAAGVLLLLADVTENEGSGVEEPAVGPVAEGSPMDLNTRQARYGVVYLRSIAAQAGIGLQETSPGEDVLAIDALLNFKEGDLRVQVKTSRCHDMDPALPEIRYPAKQQWIARWAENYAPCYFVVVVVPADSGAWLDHHKGGTHMAGTAGYWTRIDVAALRQQPTVVVPKAQRLGADTMTVWHRDLVEAYGGR